jgi:hypothetical protein
MTVRKSNPWLDRLKLLVLIGIGFLAMGKKCHKGPDLDHLLPADCRQVSKGEFGEIQHDELLTAETTPHDPHTKQAVQSISGGFSHSNPHLSTCYMLKPYPYQNQDNQNNYVDRTFYCVPRCSCVLTAADNFVLTAAHCLFSSNTRQEYPQDYPLAVGFGDVCGGEPTYLTSYSYRAATGSWSVMVNEYPHKVDVPCPSGTRPDLATRDNANRYDNIYRVIRRKRIREFDPALGNDNNANIANDLAFLILDRPVSASVAEAVKLATSKDLDDITNNHCMLGEEVGYGLVNTDGRPSFAPKSCFLLFKYYNMMWGFNTLGGSSKIGDSGGGFYGPVYDSGSGVREGPPLLGIISAGNDSLTRGPSVLNHDTWIRAGISSAIKWPKYLNKPTTPYGAGCSRPVRMGQTTPAEVWEPERLPSVPPP